jgi:hypothetical protein
MEEEQMRVDLQKSLADPAGHAPDLAMIQEWLGLLPRGDVVQLHQALAYHDAKELKFFRESFWSWFAKRTG